MEDKLVCIFGNYANQVTFHTSERKCLALKAFEKEKKTLLKYKGIGILKFASKNAFSSGKHLHTPLILCGKWQIATHALHKTIIHEQHYWLITYRSYWFSQMWSQEQFPKHKSEWTASRCCCCVRVWSEKTTLCMGHKLSLLLHKRPATRPTTSVHGDNNTFSFYQKLQSTCHACVLEFRFLFFLL